MDAGAQPHPEGDPGICKSPRCRAKIWWRLLNGKGHPYNTDGTSHFATCPDSSTFRRKKP